MAIKISDTVVIDDSRNASNLVSVSAASSVTASAFYGDGSNLENTGATLNSTSGVERLVTTQLSSGTMVNAATDADLTYNATTDTLSTPNFNVGTGVNVYGSTGIVSATSFYGDGSNLDGIVSNTTFLVPARAGNVTVLVSSSSFVVEGRSANTTIVLWNK